MSGAEVLAVLGATSSVITICETCAAIVRFIQKRQLTPGTASLKPQLNLLANIVTQLKPLNLDSYGHGLDGVLAGCEKELRALFNLFEEFQKASTSSLLKRSRKSFKIPIWEEKIQQSWGRIQQYQMSISLYLDFYKTKQLLCAPRTEASLWFVPFRTRPTNFMNRQDIFNQISLSIHQCTQYPCILSLTGLGGIGKTEIALELCRRERTTYSVIIWINAEDEARVTESLIKFANRLSTGQQTFNKRETSLAYIQEVANDRTQPWLLVLDDCDIAGWDPNFLHLFGDGGQRDVVITTSRHPMPLRGIQIQIQIPPISAEDGAQYLLDLTLSSDTDQVKAVRVLAKQVGYLPLALAQVGGYMRTSGFAPQKVLENFLRETKAFEKQMFSTKENTLWSQFFETIKREDPLLLDFLLQLSFIAIPVEFMLQEYFLVAQSRGEPLPSFYQLFVYNNRWSSALFLRAVQRLATYSIVREELVGESGVMIISIHRLVKQALQTEVIPAGINSHCQLMLQATAIIAASLSAHDWEELSVHQRPLFHESILECIKERKCMNDPDLIKKYSGISEGYQTTFAAFLSIYSNEEKQPKDLLLQSLGLQSTWLGESASLTCTTMTWLALLYLESMCLDEAEALIDRLYIAESQAPKAQNIFLVDVQLMQGHLQMRRQKIDDAVSIFKHCTELYANVVSISSASTASALISGVEAMLIQGNVEEATQSLYEAEHIQKHLGGARALGIRVKWNIARHSLRMGDHVRATSRYKELCEEHKTNHDLVGPPLHRWESLHCELGDVYLDLGDVQKATVEYDIGRASASRRSRSLKIDPRDISQWLIHGSLERTKFVPHSEG